MLRRRRPLILLILLLTVLPIAFLWYRQSAPPAPGLADTPSFDVDSVRALTWTDHGRSWTGERADLLESLARVRLVPNSIPSRQDVSVTLAFTDGSQWTGVYGDGRFVWTEGQLRGRGFATDRDLDALFQEGEFVFRNRNWLWCTGRVMRLEFEVGGRTLGLRDTHHGWRGQRDGRDATVDTAKLDSWLKGHCEIRVDRYRDLRAYPLDSSTGSVRFVAHFLDGGRIELREKDGLWAIGAQPFAFRSQGWDEAVKELGTTID